MTVLIIILLVFLLIALLRVGAALRLEDGTLYLKIVAGPIKLKILPKTKESAKKPKDEGKKKKPKKEKEKKETVDEGGEEEKKKKFPITLELITSILSAVADLLGRFRRKLSIDKLTLHYTVASADPYSAAMTFGYASMAVNALVPVLDRTFKIKDRDIGAAVDFNSKENIIFADVQLTLAIWEIIYIALAVVPAIKAVLREYKKGKVEKNGQASDK